MGFARRAQRWMGASWLAVMVAGQGVFLLYVLGLYGRATLRGDRAAWATTMPRGLVPGDGVGNTAVVAHIALAVVILAAGAVQLLPVVRRRLPALHRWSGRVYLGSCLATSVAGVWLVWARGTVGDTSQHLAITGNALLLVASTVMAWRTARARDIAAHRRWALHVVLFASGVFHFRILLALWLVLHRGPVGFDPQRFAGPFLTVLAWSVYVVLPPLGLALVERARRSARGGVHLAAAVGLAALTVITAAGVGAAWLLLWAPRLR
ncbi:MAG: DUF2306 domain-containing protein [Gemmatimonadetes bacterium]|nr:DUF2306 domain-containing protein [Gemmatimonadota bacterium]